MITFKETPIVKEKFTVTVLTTKYSESRFKTEIVGGPKHGTAKWTTSQTAARNAHTLCVKWMKGLKDV